MFDVHFHWIPAEFIERARAKYPNELLLGRVPYEKIEDSLRNRDEFGIETSLIDVGAQLEQCISAYPGPRSEAFRVLNERGAELRQRYPGRFLHCAAVDVLAGEEAVPQLDYAVRQLGCSALEMVTSYAENGETVFPHERRFWPLYKKAEELGVPILYHPVVPPFWKSLPAAIHFTSNDWGFLLGDQLAVHLLACGGVFDAFPTLKFIFCQLGGFLPVSLGRSDLGFIQNQELKNRAMSFPDMKLVRIRDYVGRFYVDTHSADAVSIRCAADNLGLDRVLLATDFPITRPQIGAKWHIEQARDTGLGMDAFKAITSLNARSLFGI